MKRILLTSLAFISAVSLVHASEPPVNVPDTGGTAGLLLVGALLTLALRRRTSRK